MATRRVSHTGSRPRPPARTVGQALARATDQLSRARLYYGHGTDNPGDDAAALVWHVMGLEGDADRRTLARRLPRGAQLLLDLLLARREPEGELDRLEVREVLAAMRAAPRRPMN